MTPVQVWNMALDLIGQRPVSQEGESTREAETCARNWEQALQIVLARGAWTGARKRATLARVATDPAFGWTAQYELPADFLRVVETNAIDWMVEGGRFLTDADTADTIELVYITKSPVLDRLHPELIDAIAAELAARICSGLTHDKGQAEKLAGLANERMFAAMGADGAQLPPQEQAVAPVLAGRG